MTAHPTLPRPDVRHVLVVIPARDEEALLPRCLGSIDRAADALRRARPDVTLSVTIVLDRCTDLSETIVRGHLGVHPVVIAAGAVGHARGAGVEDAVAQLSPSIPADQVWLACTDADSSVPDNWLTLQVELAEQGLHLVVGSVSPDPSDLDPTLLARWREQHTLADGHQHVHGANLGVSLSAYLAVGGFLPAEAHEDVHLVAAVRALPGVRHLSTGRHNVLTSGRLDGRAPEGFATWLRDAAAAESGPGRDDAAD